MLLVWVGKLRVGPITLGGIRGMLIVSMLIGAGQQCSAPAITAVTHTAQSSVPMIG